MGQWSIVSKALTNINSYHESFSFLFKSVFGCRPEKLDQICLWPKLGLGRPPFPLLPLAWPWPRLDPAACQPPRPFTPKVVPFLALLKATNIEKDKEGPDLVGGYLVV